ncbi:hypothetical protein SADUNF_Sadunf16G0138000 [Salix dunnii]|uniref:Uncharacterized protein n=1 Tax=Salix dunnii TaxID=1413687 RepID=A0A835J6Q0_9ROSI|nr:hypothetical protein SADUNF_Sadunf16G0138000 [Salix dunnii]
MTEEDVYTKDGTVDYHGNPETKSTHIPKEGLRLYYRRNQQSATATRNNLNWGGTCYLTPLIGAFFVDAYFCRYWTIACFPTIYVMGMTPLTISATFPGSRPKCYSEDDCHPADSQNQFDDADEVEKKTRVLSSTGSTSQLMSVLLLPVLFWFVYKIMYPKPGGSPLTRICQVLVALFRKKKAEVLADKALLCIEYLKSVGFDRYLRKAGLGKEDRHLLKQVNEIELALLYERRESPYPGDAAAMEEFVAKGKDTKFKQEAQKLWFRMRNEVIQELQEKGTVKVTHL